jgi:hypothetical protein
MNAAGHEPLKTSATSFGRCPLCGREMIDDGRSTDKHHMVPKSRGGVATTRLHRVCHVFIHSRWTLRELETNFPDPQAILADPGAQAFVAWVMKKDPQYYDRSIRASRKGPKR